MNKNQAGNKP